MSTELKNLLYKIEQLPDDEQKQLIQLIEEEIAWAKTFESTQDELGKMAKEPEET